MNTTENADKCDPLPLSTLSHREGHANHAENYRTQRVRTFPLMASLIPCVRICRSVSRRLRQTNGRLSLAGHPRCTVWSIALHLAVSLLSIRYVVDERSFLALSHPAPPIPYRPILSVSYQPLNSAAPLPRLAPHPTACHLFALIPCVRISR